MKDKETGSDKESTGPLSEGEHLGSPVVNYLGLVGLEVSKNVDIQNDQLGDEWGNPIGIKHEYLKEGDPEPENLKKFLGVHSKGGVINLRLKEKVYKSYRKLKTQAQDDGIFLSATSAFRSLKHQGELFDTLKVKKSVEKPGFSEHHLGTTVDFRKVENNSKEFLWLLNNAFSDGWIPTYYFRENAKIIKETWHWRYVGKDSSMKFYDKWKNEIEKAKKEIPKNIPEDNPETKEVAWSELNFRPCPADTTTNKPLGMLKKGDKVKVLGTELSGTWSRIENPLDQKQVAYVISKSLTEVGEGS